MLSDAARVFPQVLTQRGYDLMSEYWTTSSDSSDEHRVRATHLVDTLLRQDLTTEETDLAVGIEYYKRGMLDAYEAEAADAAMKAQGQGNGKPGKDGKGKMSFLPMPKGTGSDKGSDKGKGFTPMDAMKAKGKGGKLQKQKRGKKA